MVTLRERLGMRPAIELQADADALDMFDRMIEQEFERVERETLLDEQLPADLKTRNSADTIERGVERLSDAYLFAIRKCVEATGMTPSEIDNVNYANRVDESFDERDEPDVILTTDRERWIQDMLGDLEGNFIYNEYLFQLFSEKPVAESYSYYSIYVAVQAALKFVAEYPNVIEALDLRTVDKTITGTTGQEQTYRFCELRDQAIKFLDWASVDEIDADNIFAYVGQAEYWVPGIGAIADKLLRDYSEGVRVERDRLIVQKKRVLDTPLPDEEMTIEPETLRRIQRIYGDMRMSRAILSYQSDPTGRSAREVARDYGVGYTRLLKELQDRGLVRSRGGDRKAKKSA